ncbi:polysaccharide pyruvyl transferase family protein [Gloeobacter kilaueensis]|uniref:Polysaccharide pyruvyl transferase domain-containing protein n=1 Tax=Gloeobacter kilaueensis (strain ATCC BAA-2537 / CCAP 1431/1 / ULC 316 / JS1) TaxID=1183438 RepID=U5QCD7_GLOK1|nr:polysaccharide pyruvyl transferase family protein [Gloeobacter kilaueensis]AGY56531.1 hypothetical protein GKIL_0284 [Gloeobacter kilaueensis JS1]
MKVGILTFHHTTNYGAMLQNYALAKTIAAMGFDVEDIDYRPYRAVRYYLKENFLPGRPLLSNLIKYWKMSEFRKAHIKLSNSTCYTREGLQRYRRNYDAVICGSDQVWCIDSFRRYDPSYFLDFIDQQATRKISYAASAAWTTTFGQHKQKTANLLRHFSAISVRDANTRRLVKEECGLDAPCVLDPTFLVNYDELLATNTIPQKSPYLLIYKMGPMQRDEEKFILELARSKNLEVLSVGYSHKIATRRNFIGIGPQEWVNYFANSQYVFTDSYHGTIFSIIFRKPFNVFVDTTKATKTGDLLLELGLTDRIFGTGATTDQVDYTFAAEKLARQIQLSKAFLSQALADVSQVAILESGGKINISG